MRALLLFAVTAMLTGTACTLYFDTDGSKSHGGGSHGSGTTEPDAGCCGDDRDGGPGYVIDVAHWDFDASVSEDGGRAPCDDAGHPHPLDAGIGPGPIPDAR